MNLIKELVKQQNGLSARQYAAYLGVSHTHWLDTKSGKIPMGHTILAACAYRYPQLRDAIIAYLFEEGERRLSLPPEKAA